MFYLHLLDGGRNHRGSIIVITETEESPVFEININGSKIINISSDKPETFDTGWKLGPVQNKDNAKKLAYAIAREYNYDVMVDGEVIGLPYAPAVELGRRGGSSTSEAKAAAARANGRKSPGRPRNLAPQ